MKKLNPVLIFIFVICIYGFTDYNQVLNTSLKITVVDYLGNVVEGARIKKQMMDVPYTDKKGRVTFKKLEPTIFFLYVVNEDMNNVGGGV